MSVALGAAASTPTISIGRVITDTLSVMGRRAPLLAGIAFFFLFIPQALAGFLPQELSTVGLLAGLPALIFNGAAVLVSTRERWPALRLWDCRRPSANRSNGSVLSGSWVFSADWRPRRGCSR